MSLASYRVILRTPGIRALIVTSVIARMPMGFETLGIVLLVRATTGSFTIAGIAAAATNIVAAVTAAPIGRFVDRYGQRRVLLPTAAVNATALAGLATAGVFDAPAPVLVAFAALSGVIAPISSCHRAVLASTFEGPQMQSAYALESIVQETVFTGGPLIATSAAALAGPPAAVYCAAVLSSAGAVLFANTRLSREWRAPEADRGRGGAIRAPGVRLLCGFALLAAISFGGFEVAVTAFARQHDAPNTAGIFLALWAIGSAAGGLWYGSRTWRHTAGRRIGLVAIATAIAFLPSIAAPGLWALAPAAMIAGVGIAPLLSLVYSLIGELAPQGMVTEAFSWLNVAFPIGFGAGAAISGALADGAGARAALAVSSVGVGLGAATLIRWRRVLGNPRNEAITTTSP